MDLSLNVYKIPEPGQTLCDDGGIAYVPGGKGANAAVAFSRLGASAALCAKLGADSHGSRLYNYYKESGINTSYIKVDRDYQTGLAVILREPDGQNRIILYPGANNHLTGDNILDGFRFEPDALFTGFEIGFEAALAAARIAASRGIPIFIDAAPANKSYPLESLPEIEIFSPNETETLEYTGINPQGSESALRACIALYKRVKCKHVVIKQGDRGASVYDGKRFYMIPAFRPDGVVDTTAAGDTFTAAMTLEYLRTGDIRQAVTYGAAAGAIAVSRFGSSNSTPTSDEVAAFLASRASR
jgi:ribokinase